MTRLPLNFQPSNGQPMSWTERARLDARVQQLAARQKARLAATEQAVAR